MAKSSQIGAGRSQDKVIPLIISSLKEIMVDQAYSNIVVNAALNGVVLDPQSARHFRKVVYGTVERWLYLEAWLSQLTSTQKRMKTDVRMALMAALYEVAYLEGMPNHVVVNRYVNYGAQHASFAKGFINAVLRRAYQEPFNIDDPALKLDARAKLALQYSHPLWLVGKWYKQFGPEQTELLLQANLKERPLSLRVNRSRFSMQQVLQSLDVDGVSAVASPWVEGAILVERMGTKRLEELDAFQKGMFIIQDLSSQLVGHVAQPTGYGDWLDLCSAPGGKATDIAERLRLVANRGANSTASRVVACDLHPHKLDLIEQNALRLQLDNVTTKLWDALEVNPDFIGAFEGVLVDAPCSGLGIIGRKPEIKYRKRPEDLKELVGLQKRILDLASHYVKPGGNLIYSTCTIVKEENEDQIAAFLDQHKDFECVDCSGVLSASSNVQEIGESRGPFIQLLQSNEWSDGFFIAKLRKKM